MTATTCIGEPVSWPRLEAFARDATDGAVGDHVAACAACRGCLDEIRRDVVALPSLPTAPARARRRRLPWLIPVLSTAAIAAAVLALWLRPRAPGSAPPRAHDGAPVAHVKGVGDVVIGVVRDRAGSVREDARTFRAGDRFKVVVTCPPSHAVAVAVSVREDGAPADDHPLAPARLACGNRVVLPGAFALSGERPHRVCARIEDRAVACLTLSPE